MAVTSPYNWQSHSPRVRIPRVDVGRMAALLRQNGSAVVAMLWPLDPCLTPKQETSWNERQPAP